MMMYHVEFDDVSMRYEDYASVADDVQYLITLEAVEMLREYVAALGYDWERVAYVWQVAA
jgi:hypothetical protein